VFRVEVKCTPGPLCGEGSGKLGAQGLGNAECVDAVDSIAVERGGGVDRSGITRCGVTRCGVDIHAVKLLCEGVHGLGLKLRFGIEGRETPS
jgi:hypothetical protein